MCACRIREHERTKFHQGKPYYQINLTRANIRIFGGDIARAVSHWLAKSLVSCKRIALLLWISPFRSLKVNCQRWMSEKKKARKRIPTSCTINLFHFVFNYRSFCSYYSIEDWVFFFISLQKYCLNLNCWFKKMVTGCDVF